MFFTNLLINLRIIPISAGDPACDNNYPSCIKPDLCVLKRDMGFFMVAQNDCENINAMVIYYSYMYDRIYRKENVLYISVYLR
ncbi:hypothetical protein Desgi_3308 [Desulfoscipio gibsoniae DSM 7213]|uniref:Uncharacterized protein n=1 Tax=Desulfoscipio gibsoniae DSM 7213 TaxID=767817 RepID=R4KJ59_9FIRM|nr:hypothetical protein Desgi_3308 [Desulfoscipio gibsoniae DSM 7213]